MMMLESILDTELYTERYLSAVMPESEKKGGGQ